MSAPCPNCDGRLCMSCVLRQIHDECADDCPFCCEPVDVIDETERLQTVIRRQGEAIQAQRARNHNVSHSRNQWHKKADDARAELKAWRRCADQLATRLQEELDFTEQTRGIWSDPPYVCEALVAYEQLKDRVETS